jgi:glycosyltransferase involved in cell wall biosynthesis
MPKCLVSILVPVYNRANFISECLQSALRQSIQDLEVVVVDNRSTDGTWDLCQQMARLDSRIRVFRNDTNIGPVRNWARCIAEARGTLGKFLFSDDEMAPDFLEKTISFLDDPEIGIVTTAAKVETGIAYTWRAGKSDATRFLWDSMFNGRLPVSPGAALFRMEDLRRNLHDFGNHGIGPDLLLMLLTARAYPSVAHVPEPLVSFRDHEGSLSRLHRKQLSRGYALARIRFVLSLARLIHT